MTIRWDTAERLELLNRAKRGDIKAFEAVLSLYEKPIFNYLLRFTSNRRDAEDLAQETFIKVLENAGKIEPSGNFNAWVYRIATTTAYDWLRKRMRRKEISLPDDVINESESDETSADEEAYYVMEGCNVKDLRLAIENLHPEYRSVILLYYMQDLSYEEISDILQLPLNTVKTHIRRAKIALRAEFEKSHKETRQIA
jgi:RNA polymerase sigma-70 factor, ECF subfamily